MSFETPTPSTRSFLAPLNAAALDDDRATIYALTEELRIRYVNGAWARFAQENGARWTEGQWGIGTRVIDAVPAVLQPFYQRLYATALTGREVVEHDYECSSATTLRAFRMRILPCDSGLIVIHSPLRESRHPAPGAPALESRYRGASGLVSQCSHCRRVRRARGTAEWEWVPEYVERPVHDISHGLCRICAEFYYPESDDLDA